MDRIEKIKAAITNLPAEEIRRLERWFIAHEQTRWDEQLGRDSATGKLDFLFDEAETQDGEGTAQDWPPD